MSIENIIRITDGDMSKIGELLDNNSVVEVALENGEHVAKSLEAGFSEHFNAKIELIEEGENLGTCGCGKPADIIVRLSR